MNVISYRALRCLVSVWFIAAFVLIAIHPLAAEDDEARRWRELNDLSVPPILNSRMADPSWSIRYWMGVDNKDSDCVQANELMDNNATSKTSSGRRGGRRTHYLEDYINSCRNRISRILHYVQPNVKKWCAYRHTSARLETLCREWEQNGSDYIARIRNLDEPTLSRYARFIGGTR